MNIEILSRFPGIGGRTIRILIGIILVWLVFPVYTESAPGANYLLFGFSAGLLFFYLIIHFVISSYAPPLRKWVGVLIASAPVVCVYLFGGEAGKVGVLTFLGLSFLVAGIRADTGCEVMSIPNLVLNKKSTLPCLLLSPLDELEKKLTK